MLKRKTDFVPAVLCCVSRDDKRRGLIVVTKQRRRWERGAHTKRNKKERERSNFVQVNNSPVSRARTAGQLNLDGPQQCLKIHVIGLGTTIIVNRIWNWQSFVFVFFGFCFDWQSFAQTPQKKEKKNVVQLTYPNRHKFLCRMPVGHQSSNRIWAGEGRRCRVPPLHRRPLCTQTSQTRNYPCKLNFFF